MKHVKLFPTINVVASNLQCDDCGDLMCLAACGFLLLRLFDRTLKVIFYVDSSSIGVSVILVILLFYHIASVSQIVPTLYIK